MSVVLTFSYNTNKKVNKYFHPKCAAEKMCWEKLCSQTRRACFHISKQPTIIIFDSRKRSNGAEGNPHTWGKTHQSSRKRKHFLHFNHRQESAHDFYLWFLHCALRLITKSLKSLSHISPMWFLTDRMREWLFFMGIRCGTNQHRHTVSAQ